MRNPESAGIGQNNSGLSEIRAAVQAILGPEDRVVIVHSALYGLGTIGRDVGGVLRALMEGLGPDRTLVMPTFNFNFCQGDPYSHRRTVSQVGVLTESFRALPGVIRSPHPIYSFSGLGPLAGEVCRHEGRTAWGAATPFELFLSTDAVYLMFGVSWERACTQFHRAEELLSVPYRYWKEFSGQADFGEGPRAYSTSMYVRRREPKHYIDFSPIARRMEHEGVEKVHPLARGTLRAARVRDADRIAREVVGQNPFALYIACDDRPSDTPASGIPEFEQR